MTDMIAGETVAAAEDLATRWSEVTDLELVFAVRRAEAGTTAATLALLEELREKPSEWAAQCLAVAVAALDDVRRNGQLPGPAREEAVLASS
ncbi:hypothetical protein [Amycolatopsis echigonensis]|uniref:Uncharacterized protein n=1 Tax=Amycolatopsis echigonensis TaxID=2576905 RepID=A0A8E1W881_9PSEU|nr:hypothetical protein [Amycolatopsis echigonensis]MBB2505931.1 hypothetical protein [Amycolatopsis echigonensis]